MGLKAYGRTVEKTWAHQDPAALTEVRSGPRKPECSASAKPQITKWDRSKTRYPPSFYTYRLLDPQTGVAFYVGKGQRNRAWDHDARVKRGDFSGNARKVAKIREIIERGDEIEIDIVACYELESDALDHEFRLVDASPALTNIAAGGGGTSASRERQARKALFRAEKLRRLREAEGIRSAGKCSAALLNVASSPAERDEIAYWLGGLRPTDEKGVRTSIQRAAQANEPNRRYAR